MYFVIVGFRRGMRVLHVMIATCFGGIWTVYPGSGFVTGLFLKWRHAGSSLSFESVKEENDSHIYSSNGPRIRGVDSVGQQGRSKASKIYRMNKNIMAPR